MIPNLLSIAGTDPSGGAGIQADLKTFGALRTHGMSVITALVAQTTTGVTAVHDVPPEFVSAQLDTLFDDVRVDAVKIGMLSNAGVVEAVAAALEKYRPPYVVLDPVMVAKSGDRLLTPDAMTALRDRLLPLVDLVTPNAPEAADLLDEAEPRDAATMQSAAERLAEAGGIQVLLKGGHVSGPGSDDVLVAEGRAEWLTVERVETTNDHGTGCTLSAAIAALRPQRDSWSAAIRGAKDYVTGALRTADRLDVGHGHGPVNHYHLWW